MNRLFIALGRVRGPARDLAARSLRLGRRSAALGALLLAASAVTVWATTDTPPHFTSLTVTPSVVNEGQTVVLKGTFTDPDVTDAHGLQIYWYGGGAGLPPSLKEKVELPPGQLSFQVSHTYTDDLAPTNIHVRLFDRQHPIGSNDNTDGIGGQDLRWLPFQVKNVAPSFVPGIAVTKDPRVPGKVVIDGSVTDPGTDRLTVLANFGDGQPTHQLFPPLPDGVSQCALSGHTFHCEHQYAVSKLLPPKTFPIKLGVQDDDGGVGAFQTSVQIP